MEMAVIVIAVCMAVLTVFALGALLVFMVLGVKAAGTLRRVEGMLDDVRRESLPILAQSRMLVEDAREVSRTVRHQVGRSEFLVENTIRNVTDITTRVRESVTGISLILSTVGRIAGLFAGKSGKND